MQIWKTRDMEDSYPPLKTLIYRKGGRVRQAQRLYMFQIVIAKGRTAYREGEAGCGGCRNRTIEETS